MALTSAQRDVLVELGNIAISRAARQLSVLLDEPIHISVPEVELATASEAAQHLALSGGEVACVYQRMTGALAGRIALLLPSRESHMLFQDLLGTHTPLQGLDLRAFEHEALTEIGNIIISSCVSAIADMLSLRIDVSVPRFAEAAATDLFSDEAADRPDLPALLIHTHLTATQRQLDGMVVLMLSAAAAEKVMLAVQAMILAND